MLPCQRALFNIPREICYLNAASYSPLPLAAQEAGRAGVARKGQPWTLAPSLAADYARGAQALGLPEKDVTDQAVAVEAVRQWFGTHPRWLLVFDSASS